MLIPGGAPAVCVLIDYWEEEMVEQPEVLVILDIETIEGLQLVEKVLPLFPKPNGDINPDAFNTNIVNTSGEALKQGGNGWLSFIAISLPAMNI